MKKIVFGLLFGIILLSGCTDQSDQTETGEDVDLQKTVESLRVENKALREGLNTTEEPATETTDPSNLTEELYGMNQELTLSDGEQETAKIKIVEATTNQSAFPEHMINLDSYDTTKMVAVKIEYTNIAIEEPFLPFASYFQAYDKDGKALIQVSQQSGQDAVPIGRTATTQLYWELPVAGHDFNELEIDFVPKSKIATFDLKVTH